jgi:hypothetical protein
MAGQRLEENSMDGSNGNGAGERPNGTQKLTITFTPETFALHVDLNVMNADCALAMLEQAKRWVEKQIRLASLVEAQNALAQNARDAQIAQHLRSTAR